MKVIGGFYELLLPAESFGYHKGALALSNGRACTGVIINNIDIKKCYLPNFTCNAVYHPFEDAQVPFELYNINEQMDVVNPPTLQDGEYFYYINYYGVKNNIVQKLHDLYGDRLIIDNTHDFFKKQQHNCWSFTSARKYFGVPDGAFLYSPIPLQNNFDRFNLYSLEHNIERLKGNQRTSFTLYQNYEQSLTCDIKKISIVSEKLLSSVDIELVKFKRRKNFQILHDKLGSENLFNLTSLAEDDIPFAYPFLPKIIFNKSKLYPLNIFIPTLWADPLSRKITTPFESKLASNLMPLPIDERYNAEDINFMVNQILKILKDV